MAKTYLLVTEPNWSEDSNGNVVGLQRIYTDTGNMQEFSAENDEEAFSHAAFFPGVDWAILDGETGEYCFGNRTRR